MEVWNAGDLPTDAFDEVDDPVVPREDDVKRFLAAIDEHATQAIEDLARTVLPLLTSDVERVLQDNQSMKTAPTDVDVVLFSIQAPVVALRRALVKWAKRYHLLTEDQFYVKVAYKAIALHKADQGPIQLQRGLAWLYDQSHVLDAIFPFTFTPSRAKMQRTTFDEHGNRKKVLEPKWQDAARYEGLREYEGLLEQAVYEATTSEDGLEQLQQIGMPHWTGVAWNPSGDESWNDFKKKMTDAFNGYLKAYKARMESITPSPTEAPHHFEWLALHQVAGLSHGRIAKLYPGDTADERDRERAISSGIQQAAKRVQIVLRPADKGGRKAVIR